MFTIAAAASTAALPTLALFLALQLPVGVRPAQPHRPVAVQVAEEWNNEIIRGIVRETELWVELQKSLQTEPPGRVLSARRMEIYDELVAEYTARIKSLKKMKKAEEH